jgi:voltage-gated potassium channel
LNVNGVTANLAGAAASRIGHIAQTTPRAASTPAISRLRGRCLEPHVGRMLRDKLLEKLTPMRAARLVAFVTLLVTCISGLAMRVVDGREYPTIGRGLWWAAQTVTSVGYGDVVPKETAGRIVAVLVMFNAIALLTVVTGAVTATLIEGTRRRAATDARHSDPQLAEIARRLRHLEDSLR